MTKNVSPIHRLTTSYSVDDLERFVDGEGPFLSVFLPASSEHHDAGHRLSVRWDNARRDATDRWSSDALGRLDGLVDGVRHDSGESIAVFDRADETSLLIPLSSAVRSSVVQVSAHPRLVPVLEDRQRTLPHVVVLTDRAGAEITAFDGGSIIETDEVEGDTEHINRSAPGGWSQRRFQQRAENTWEKNASDVANAVVALSERVDPLVVVVAGDVRARTLVAESLADSPLSDLVVTLDEGAPDAIAEATLREVADRHARLQRAVLDQLRTSDGVVDPADVLEALSEGRVDTLLVNDVPGERTDAVDGPVDVDRAVVEAIKTAARIVVVPKTPELRDGVAAITRW